MEGRWRVGNFIKFRAWALEFKVLGQGIGIWGLGLGVILRTSKNHQVPFKVLEIW